MTCCAAHCAVGCSVTLSMDDAAPFVGQDDKDKQHFARHRWNSEKITGNQVLHVVVQEGPPRLVTMEGGAWWAILLYGRFGHMDTQLCVFSNDAR